MDLPIDIRPTESQLLLAVGASSSKRAAAVRFHCPVDGCRRRGEGTRGTHFASAKLLVQHFQKTHTEKRHRCSECSARFALARDLRYHQKKPCPSAKCAEKSVPISNSPLPKGPTNGICCPPKVFLVPINLGQSVRFRHILPRFPIGGRRTVATQTDECQRAGGGRQQPQKCRSVASQIGSYSAHIYTNYDSSNAALSPAVFEMRSDNSITKCNNIYRNRSSLLHSPNYVTLPCEVLLVIKMMSFTLCILLVFAFPILWSGNQHEDMEIEAESRSSDIKHIERMVADLKQLVYEKEAALQKQIENSVFLEELHQKNVLLYWSHRVFMIQGDNFRGTAILLNKKQFVTTAHLGIVPGKTYVIWQPGGQAHSVECCVELNAVTDFAILHSQDALNVDLRFGELTKGATFFIVSYPYGTENNGPRFDKGIIGEVGNGILGTPGSNVGSSGGAVLNLAGELAGIIIGSDLKLTLDSPIQMWMNSLFEQRHVKILDINSILTSHRNIVNN